jgi:hypothetical protein
MRQLLPAYGYELRLFDAAPVPDAPDAVTGDLADRAALREAVRGADAVVHLAGISLEAPFDQIDWTKDYESPFKSDEGQSFWEANGNYPPPALVCKKARKLSPSSFHDLVLQDAIVLDLPSRVHEIDQLRCVILGTQKVGRPGESRRHYAMVLAPSSSRHSGAYSRVGVGVVKDSDVCWGPEEEVEIY